LTHETTRSAYKVVFIRKEKRPLEMDREPGKSLAPYCFYRVFVIVVLSVGE
jgi:hypothetical protein